MLKYAKAYADARIHAREVYPEESCGLIVKGEYIRCDNIAKDPEFHEEDNKDCTCRLCSFEISPSVYAQHVNDVDVIVHSHPNGPHYPSKLDMEAQLQTGKEWAIIALDAERVSTRPVCWGGEIQPLLGREFMHGVTDCYSIIQDAFALGKDKLAEQGIHGWPYDPINLPHAPREDGWWEGEADLYIENFERAGFEIVKGDPRPGDVFLTSVRSKKNNHGGILIGDGLIVHHLPERLSRREPAGLWGRSANIWLRHKGTNDA